MKFHKIIDRKTIDKTQTKTEIHIVITQITHIINIIHIIHIIHIITILITKTSNLQIINSIKQTMGMCIHKI